MQIMSTRVDQAKQVPDAATQNEKKKKEFFQSNYKLEKQFLPRHDEEIPSTKRKIHLMRKIQEIAYESSRFRGVLTFMGIESGRKGILKYFKMTVKNSEAVPKLKKVSKIQAAVGKFQFFNFSNLRTKIYRSIYIF